MVSLFFSEIFVLPVSFFKFHGQSKLVFTKRGDFCYRLYKTRIDRKQTCEFKGGKKCAVS